MKLRRFVMALGLLAASQTANSRLAEAGVVYSNNFTGGAGSEWSNPAVSLSNGEYYLASSANGFGNGTVSLNLSSLAAHTTVTLNFDLYIIQSWDGNGPAGGGADNWQLRADGSNVLYSNFANYNGSGNNQSYPDQLPPYGPGGSNPNRTGAFAVNHLGFGDATNSFGDTTYRFSFTLSHTASSVVFDFTSFQNQPPGDEGWGLDNVQVSTNAVPEPASLVLLGISAIGLGLGRWRKLSRESSLRG